jgi:uncharacterized BrkB/YihY/UPF0761 family membrane protein
LSALRSHLDRLPPWGLVLVIWAVSRVLVATLLGALAVLALYRLLVSRVGVHSALWAAALVCFGP